MRMKSVLLGFATAGAIVLSTFAVTLPASAAPVNSHTVSSSAPSSSMSPDSYGALLCSGNLCVQRVTSVYNGRAWVEAWANNYGFTGHFALYGPNGWMANSATKYWYAGGTGQQWDIPQGGGYTIIAWRGQYPGPYSNIGQVNFGV